jgi:hypothetical protein
MGGGKGVGLLAYLEAGRWHRVVRRGLVEAISGQTTKGGGIGSLGGRVDVVNSKKEQR